MSQASLISGQMVEPKSEISLSSDAPKVQNKAIIMLWRVLLVLVAAHAAFGQTNTNVVIRVSKINTNYSLVYLPIQDDTRWLEEYGRINLPPARDAKIQIGRTLGIFQHQVSDFLYCLKRFDSWSHAVREHGLAHLSKSLGVVKTYAASRDGMVERGDVLEFTIVTSASGESKLIVEKIDNVFNHVTVIDSSEVEIVRQLLLEILEITKPRRDRMLNPDMNPYLNRRK